MESHNHGRGNFIRELIFGFNDGLVTILALTAGMASAISNNAIIILAAMIAALGGAVSMALGSYISTKSQSEVYRREMDVEKREIEETPNLERKEIEEIYKKKGFKGKQLKMVVDVITSNKKVWLDTMMKDELGLAELSFKNPIKSGLVMLAAFIIGSMIPVSSYFFLAPSLAVLPSITISLAGLFLIGAAKSRITGRSWLKSGIEILVVGAIAAAVGYYIGVISSIYLGVSV